MLLILGDATEQEKVNEDGVSQVMVARRLEIEGARLERDALYSTSI